LRSPRPLLQAANRSRAGGAASAYEGVETYEPQSVSWGRFPRPKNIPEAFGDKTLDVPLGGVDLTKDKDWEDKYKALMARASVCQPTRTPHTWEGWLS
jgi:hypothetical protein